jgi:hypothetical protein
MQTTGLPHGIVPRLLPRRTAIFAAAAICMGTLAPLLVAEIILRFLPVHSGSMAVAVNARNPVFHFTPNRAMTWSRDWNFSIVNRTRTNNEGYVNERDYDVADPRPLCAVVGDSYVEASMIPFAQTLHGRLAAAFAPQARVYSFGASGAPLSQYLIWAREARQRFKAQALAIVVIANDWDESLATYKIGPGFHHYVEGSDGSLMLRRFDYEPTWRRELVRSSALLRYLVYNLQVHEHLEALAGWRQAFVGSAFAQDYVGNTRAEADQARVEHSKAAIEAFFRDLREFAGWTPERVVFVVDGIRYPSNDPMVLNSYFVQLRAHFMANARARGFEVVDMDRHFFADFQARGESFEFPTDGHWNGRAHGIVADALAATRVFSQCARASTSAIQPRAAP